MLTQLIFGLSGGLSLFIYGINITGEGLQKLAGDKIRNIIKVLTTNRFSGVLVGIIITSIIQSSSATSVLAIGFVNSGLMTFEQSLSIIFGANIGTTITTQIIAFKLTTYCLPILTIGFLLNFICKKRIWKNIGLFLLGLGMLFLGMSIMSGAIEPFATDPMIKDLFIKFSVNPSLGILTGIIATAIFQSSSVTTGIVLALASVGLVDLTGAIPIILGCNIGTCVTALLASIGTNTNAKRTAIGHLIFNILGVLLFLPFIKYFQLIVMFTSTNIMRQCAFAHTIFNVIGTLLILPFIGLFTKLIIKLIPNKDGEECDPFEMKHLDEHLLSTPSIAIDTAIKEILHTLKMTSKMIELAIEGFFGKIGSLDKIEKKEDIVDYRREKITEYLVKLMEQDISHEESQKIPKLLHVINDIEKIGDHSINLRNLARRKNDGKLPFTGDSIAEIVQIHESVKCMIDQTEEALSSLSIEKAKLIYNTENKINTQRRQFKKNHIERLKNKKCNPISGIIFLDIINNLEKIGDFLTNVADAIVGRL